MNITSKLAKWGLYFRYSNKQKGHLIWDNGKIVMFATRKEVREYAEKNYGYIKHRKDLRVSPHFWRMPVPVKIKSITYEL